MTMLRPVVTCLALLMLTECSLTSLKPGVQQASLDYATVFDEFNNQGILRNVLRASDNEPLSFADIPILHGSFTMQATLGLSAPFGPIHGGSGLETATPALQFTSNPTFDTNPLNTSGFSLEIIQPTSPTFVVGSWQAGVSKELLLRLFIESVEFTKSGRRYRVENDPYCANSARLTPKSPDCAIVEGNDVTLLTLLQTALASKLDLRLFTFYLQLGTEDNPAKLKQLVDLSTAVGDKDLHIGNGSTKKNFGVYRSVEGVAMGCLDRVAFNEAAKIAYSTALSQAKNKEEHDRITNFEINPPSLLSVTTPRVAERKHTLKNGKADGEPLPPPSLNHAARNAGDRRSDIEAQIIAAPPNSFSLIAHQAAPKPPGTPSAPTPSSGGAASAAPQQSEVRPGQLSSIVDWDDCASNPQVLPPISEADASLASEQGILIHWRSIASIFRYVGAIVAEQEAEQDKSLPGAEPTFDPTDSRWSWRRPDGTWEVLFKVTKNPPNARVEAGKYGISPASHDGYHDDSLMVMALLSQLLNDSRISGDIPATQRLEIVR